MASTMGGDEQQPPAAASAVGGVQQQRMLRNVALRMRSLRRGRLLPSKRYTESLFRLEFA